MDSILAQTLTDFELILVDDGSPDNCGKICDAYAEKDNRIRVIHKENGGVSSARNAGLDVAVGDYIAFVDSDDWVSPKFLEYLYKTLHAYSADISYCNLRRVKDYAALKNDGIRELEQYPMECHSGEESINNFFSLWIQPNIYNKLIKRSLFENLRFPSAKRSEDLWVSYQLLTRANCVAGIKTCGLYFYYQREGSAMRDVSATNIDDEFTMRFDIFSSLLIGRMPVAKKFADQTFRVFFDFCMCSRNNKNKDVHMCLLHHRKKLAKEMWLPLAQSKAEKLELSILYLSPSLYTLLRLIQWKIIKRPIYVE